MDREEILKQEINKGWQMFIGFMIAAVICWFLSCNPARADSISHSDYSSCRESLQFCRDQRLGYKRQLVEKQDSLIHYRRIIKQMKTFLKPKEIEAVEGLE